MHARGNAIRVFAVVVFGGVLTLLSATHAQDFSVDPTSPEVPFTFSPGDVVKHDGSGLSIAASFLGLDATDNVDAFSYGDDQVEPAGLENLVNFDFSVDRGTVGNGGAVSRQVGMNGAAGDKFRIIRFKSGRTVGPFLQADAPNHQLTPQTGGTGQSDLDGMSLPNGTTMPVYFSLDRNGSAKLPTAGPADILVVEQTPGTPVVFATAAQLGLSASDNIDALAMVDRGKRSELDGRDEVYISLDQTSPTRATFFPGGGDGVIRIWPKPSVVTLGPDQLDLGTAGTEELNAMTARDPGPDRSMVPTGKKKPGSVPRYAFDLGGGSVRFAVGRYREDDEPVRTVSVTATKDDAQGFLTLGGIAGDEIQFSYRLQLTEKLGMRVGESVVGAELDFPAVPPGMFPSVFFFSGLTPTSSGVTVFANSSGSGVGNVISYDGADSVEFLVSYRDGTLEASSRVTGELKWDLIYTNFSFGIQKGPVGLGLGVSSVDRKARVDFSHLQIGGDLYPRNQPYLTDLGGASSFCSNAVRDLGWEDAPDFDSAKQNVEEEILILGGTRIDFKAPQYEGGLMTKLEDESEGALWEGTSKKKVLKLTKSAFRRVVKAQKALERSKPSAKKAIKQLLGAEKKMALAAQLLQAGTTKF